MFRKWLISFLLLVLVSTARAASNADVEIPLEKHDGLLWIKATTVKAGQTLNLLLDTGAGVSVLNAGAAERLGLAPGRSVTVRGVESTFAGHALRPIALVAGGVHLPQISLSVDLHRLSDSCITPLDGLLGADFFQGRTVQIDLEANKLRILSTLPDATCRADSLPLQVRSCGMLIPINVNGGGPQWVRLDTGCLSALQWVTSRIRTEDCSRKAAIGLTELSIPQAETTVRIGSHTFDRVSTGIHEKPIFAGEAGLLGNGLLSRFRRITIDAAAGRLFLEARSKGT